MDSVPITPHTTYVTPPLVVSGKLTTKSSPWCGFGVFEASGSSDFLCSVFRLPSQYAAYQFPVDGLCVYGSSPVVHIAFKGLTLKSAMAWPVTGPRAIGPRLTRYLDPDIGDRG